MTDQDYMKRAVKLARNGLGLTSPNPMVGALIIKGEKIIGEGWHHKFGDNHAEVEAIENAGLESFEGCTLYVTLEPCNHYGKTPPCTDLIIKKKFAKVVIGMLDPNPIAGGGKQKLIDAGIEVVSGIGLEECRYLNRAFIKNVTSRLPFIMLKIAMTLDGCVATGNFQSKYITCEESLTRAHKLRAEFDAILIGKNTALYDNPRLTVRKVNGRDPLKVVCDTNLLLPLDLNLFKNENRANTIVCCSTNAATSRKAEILKLAGVRILPIEISDELTLDVSQLIKGLYAKFNIGSIMVEGGAGIFSSFMQSGIVDEIQAFMAPKIIGNGIHAFSSFKIENLNMAPQFDLKEISKSGVDIHAVYEKPN